MVLENSFRSNKVKEKVFKMAKRFAKRGSTKQNIRKYQKLDKQMKELANGAVSKVSKKNFGYMRNPDMTLCGHILLVYKMMLDCRSRNTPPTTALKKRAATLGVDLTKFETLSRGGLRQEVCKRRVALRKSQKTRKAGQTE